MYHMICYHGCWISQWFVNMDVGFQHVDMVFHMDVGLSKWMLDVPQELLTWGLDFHNGDMVFYVGCQYTLVQTNRCWMSMHTLLSNKGFKHNATHKSGMMLCMVYMMMRAL